MLDVWQRFDRNDDKESIGRDRFGFGKMKRDWKVVSIMIIHGRDDEF